MDTESEDMNLQLYYVEVVVAWRLSVCGVSTMYDLVDSTTGITGSSTHSTKHANVTEWVKVAH